MNKAFEKILERLILESSSCKVYKLIKPNIEDVAEFNAYKKCIEIVQEVAEEYNNGWIPCSERLPEESGEYLVTSKIYFVPDHVDEIDNYVGVKISHYSTRCGWLDDEVMAWQPLPELYKVGD